MIIIANALHSCAGRSSCGQGYGLTTNKFFFFYFLIISILILLALLGYARWAALLARLITSNLAFLTFSMLVVGSGEDHVCRGALYG
jgi:hypothetical protein